MSHDLNLAPMLALIAGGLALFLFGLELMTAGLKAVAGSGLQTALAKLTADRFRGLLAGAFVTALLNSSTITTVLMVGFVSAGLMTLNQTVPMIMGANIGSTITAQIIDDQGREMISLARIASTLEVLSDVVTTNLAALGHQRLAGGIDLARFKDEHTSEFADAVIRNLEQAIAGIGQAESTQAAQVLAAKKPIQELAESARQSLLDKLRLSERKDVASFSLASDMIEQFKQIAHFARQIARIVEELTHLKTAGSSPTRTPTSASPALRT